MWMVPAQGAARLERAVEDGKIKTEPLSRDETRGN